MIVQYEIATQSESLQLLMEWTSPTRSAVATATLKLVATHRHDATHTSPHTRTHTHTHTRPHPRTHTRTPTHTHTHTHTYTHTRTHTYTQLVYSDQEEGAVDLVPLHRHLQQQHSPLAVRDAG